ncbi:methyl-accepting chemotaxis protein [Rossellomorea sp. BNER]|nr:methyl-accepting chemotaxis protein [Rossellomorea sp. BNER]
MKQPVNNRKRILSEISLKTRLLTIILLMVFAMGTLVGVISYLKSKEAIIYSMEQRLDREVTSIYDISQNLTLAFVGNEERIDKKVNGVIKKQNAAMSQDGLNGEFFLFKDEGVIPFATSENSDIRFDEDIIQKIKRQEKGIIHTNINNEKYTLAFHSIQELKGVYVIAIPQSDYMKNVNEMTRFIILTIIISIIIVSIILTMMVQTLTSPIALLRESMKEVREGNLEVEMDIESTTPEIVSLVKSFQSMIDKMKELISNIHETTSDLSTTGDRLQQSSNSLIIENEHMVETVRIVKQGAEETAGTSDATIKHFQAMKDSINSIFTQMDHVFAKAEEMESSASKSEVNIGKMASTLDTFTQDFGEMSETISEVRKHSLSIVNVVSIIQQVAEQTKLLAFNATIEAARAGEAGKGFAVVANEIRRLAEQSSHSTTKITKTIENMDRISEKASQQFDQMLIKFKSNFSIAIDSRQSLDDLLCNINGVNKTLKTMRTDLQYLEVALPKIEESSEAFASVSEKTLEGSEEMLTAFEDQQKNVKNSHLIGEKLLNLSESLKETTSKFRVN